MKKPEGYSTSEHAQHMVGRMHTNQKYHKAQHLMRKMYHILPRGLRGGRA